MDKNKAKARKYLREIGMVEDFEQLLDTAMLSEEDKTILRMYYKEQKPLSAIADEIGLAEVTVKKRHSKILMKLGRMF